MTDNFFYILIHIILNITLNIALGILLLLLATIVFDIIHVLLHRFTKSSSRFLRVLGALHLTHHQFLDADLHIHEDLITANVYKHVAPEFILQVLVTLLFSAFFPAAAVMVALGVEFAVFVFIMWGKPGIDVNHHNVDQLKAYRPLFFCVPEYHLLHHVYPSAYFSSWIKILDYLLCSGTALQNRRVIITASNPFTKVLAAELKQYGADVQEIDLSVLNDFFIDQMQKADILILCHRPSAGSTYHELTNIFYELHRARPIPVEVWAFILNDPEEMKQARLWFFAEKVIYRLLLPGNGNVDARCAKKILKGVRRGFNYVPAQWNILSFINYLQFVLK